MAELSSMAASLGAFLKAEGQTVGVAESSAGGLISAALLAVPGASAYFVGGSVVYTQAARRTLLGVPDGAVAGTRASTEAYALIKARRVRELLEPLLQESGLAVGRIRAVNQTRPRSSNIGV